MLKLLKNMRKREILMAMLCAAGVYGVSAARQVFRARTF